MKSQRPINGSEELKDWLLLCASQSSNVRYFQVFDVLEMSDHMKRELPAGNVIGFVLDDGKENVR